MIFNIKMEEIEKELDNEDNVVECKVTINEDNEDIDNNEDNEDNEDNEEKIVTFDELVEKGVPFISGDTVTIYNIRIHKDYIFKNDYLGKGYYREKIHFFNDEINNNTKLEIFLNKFKLFWQFPVITEKRFYIQNYKNENYFGFPWATIIDKRYNLDLIYKLLTNEYNIDFSKQYYTCVQHISFRKILPLLEKLNIKTVYTPHKVIGEDSINKITLKPCPLYAINYENKYRCKFIADDIKNTYYVSKYDLLNTVDRKIIFCFAGAYNSRDYLTDIRKKIFDMKHPENCIIINTKSWHFDNVVYNRIQNFDNSVDKSFMSDNSKDYNINTDFATQYNAYLITSKYSLCPSGSGPNSIRLWESLAFGTIPILLADTLELPKHELWEKAILHIPEKDVETIPSILEKITQEEENEMRKNCLEIYDHFRNNYINCEQSAEQCEEQCEEQSAEQCEEQSAEQSEEQSVEQCEEQSEEL